MGKECMGGKLDINGVDLRCNDDEGWRLKDESTTSISGAACNMYQQDASATLHAASPNRRAGYAANPWRRVHASTAPPSQSIELACDS